jgi:hypothetical protein
MGLNSVARLLLNMDRAVGASILGASNAEIEMWLWEHGRNFYVYLVGRFTRVAHDGKGLDGFPGITSFVFLRTLPNARGGGY